MPLGRAPCCTRRSARARRAARLLLALLFVALPATGARADARSSSDGVLRRVSQAWAKENAAGVTGAMRPGGTVKLDLLLLDRGGAFQRSQAERTLRVYFGKVSRVRLKDVTPRNRQASARYRIATYEYAYKPQGRNPVVSLLTITLRSGGSDRWYVDEIRERQKRRSRR